MRQNETCDLNRVYYRNGNISFPLTYIYRSFKEAGLCLKNYAYRCMEDESRIKTGLLLSGITAVGGAFCGSVQEKEDFLKHTSCLNTTAVKETQCRRTFMQALRVAKYTRPELKVGVSCWSVYRVEVALAIVVHSVLTYDGIPSCMIMIEFDVYIRSSRISSGCNWTLRLLFNFLLLISLVDCIATFIRQHGQVSPQNLHTIMKYLKYTVLFVNPFCFLVMSVLTYLANTCSYYNEFSKCLDNLFLEGTENCSTAAAEYFREMSSRFRSHAIDMLCGFKYNRNSERCDVILGNSITGRDIVVKYLIEVFATEDYDKRVFA